MKGNEPSANHPPVFAIAVPLALPRIPDNAEEARVQLITLAACIIFFSIVVLWHRRNNRKKQ